MFKKWRLILGIMTFTLLCYGGYQAYGIYNSLNQFQKQDGESRFNQTWDQKETAPPKWEGTERVNILLLGGDSRDSGKNELPRSDSMLVASLDPVTHQANLFSILRDTYVDIPGHRDNRINTAITLGGPNLAMKTVGNLLGLDIQYYIYTDFQGFIALVDEIGGVDFYVEKDMHYTDRADGHRYDIDLKQGQQHLDGEKVLQYVRFRHDAMSDFTRTERQRELLKAVASEMKSGWNVLRMKEILEAVEPHVETNLTVSDMLKLAALGAESSIGQSAQLPPMDLIADKDVGGASVLGVRDEKQLREYVQEIIAPDIAKDVIGQQDSSKKKL